MRDISPQIHIMVRALSIPQIASPWRSVTVGRLRYMVVQRLYMVCDNQARNQAVLLGLSLAKSVQELRGEEVLMLRALMARLYRLA